MKKKKIIAIVVTVVSVVVLVFVVLGIIINSTWNKIRGSIDNLWGDTETVE